VLLGRGAACWNHEGNRTFREIVGRFLDDYDSAKLRIEKTMIVSDILDQIKEKGGRFLKKDAATKTWQVVEERQAIEKVGHAIRDKKAIEMKKEEKSSTRSNCLQGRKDLSEEGNRIDPNPPPRSLTSSFMFHVCQNDNLLRSENIAWNFVWRQGSTLVPCLSHSTKQARKNFILQLVRQRRILYEQATLNLRTASRALERLQETQDTLRQLSSYGGERDSPLASVLSSDGSTCSSDLDSKKCGKETKDSLMTLATLAHEIKNT
jgi:hypothetical protein